MLRVGGLPACVCVFSTLACGLTHPWFPVNTGCGAPAAMAFSLVSLVFEGFAGYSLILSESKVTLSQASRFSCCASKLKHSRSIRINKDIFKK